MTVYADILFLVNFSMDFLTLYFTGKVTSRSVKGVRLCLAGAIGGLLGTAVTVFAELIPFPYPVTVTVAGFLSSVLMTLAAFGKYPALLPLLRDTVLLWGSGALLGGIMTFILSLGEPVFTDSERTPTFAVAFFACFALSSVAVRMFSSKKERKTAAVTLGVCGRSYAFTALADSGNLVREPISSLPVIIVSADTVGIDTSDERITVRAVPVHSVGGDTLLMGFVPDELTVNGREVRAVVALDTANRTFGDCAGIVPTNICG